LRRVVSPVDEVAVPVTPVSPPYVLIPVLVVRSRNPCPLRFATFTRRRSSSAEDLRALPTQAKDSTGLLIRFVHSTADTAGKDLADAETVRFPSSVVPLDGRSKVWWYCNRRR
jgi:hypothetical protein